MFRYIRTAIKNPQLLYQARPFSLINQRNSLQTWGQRFSASHLSTTKNKPPKLSIDEVAQRLKDLRDAAKSCDEILSLPVGWSREQGATFKEGRELFGQHAEKLESDLKAERWDMAKIENIIWSKDHPWASFFYRVLDCVFGRGWGRK